ncbi:MAG: type II toxin-antitoxin system RelE/ParE family toxin [Candidatus Marinimicrobia bacterium]|nr:type II toxin-antitoxin system RelE/ParE family toxin [Candidatus Neomarinimicrobiota bacterium]
MTYSIRILRRAQRELSQLPNASYKRVRDVIWLLKDDPSPHGCRKLVGREGWRIRVGNYRVIYEIDEIRHILTILHVGHRRDIYR